MSRRSSTRSTSTPSPNGSTWRRLVDKVDVQAVVDKIDIDAVMDRVDLQALLTRIDLNEVLDKLDVDLLLERMDINRVLARVDIDAVLAAANLDDLVARVDLQAVVDRLDLDQIVAKVDLNAALRRVDIDALVERTEVGALMARSGSAVMAQTVDVVRSQGVGLDSFVHRWVDRILRRGRTVGTDRPAAARSPRRRRRRDAPATWPRRESPDLQGTYAGGVTRFASFVIDVLVIGLLFSLGGLVAEYVLSVVLREPVRFSESSFGARVALVVWAFVYCAYPLAAAGRTFGMAVVGVRAVRADGSDLDASACDRAGARLPAELPAVLPGVRPDPAASRPPRPPRPDRLHRGRLRVGRQGGPPAVPPQAVTAAPAVRPVSSSWYCASRVLSCAGFGNRKNTIAAPMRMATIPAL